MSHTVTVASVASVTGGALALEGLALQWDALGRGVAVVAPGVAGVDQLRPRRLHYREEKRQMELHEGYTRDIKWFIRVVLNVQKLKFSDSSFLNVNIFWFLFLLYDSKGNNLGQNKTFDDVILGFRSFSAILSAKKLTD